MQCLRKRREVVIMSGNILLDISMWIAAVFFVIVGCRLGLLFEPKGSNTNTVDKNKKALSKKHEVLPLLFKVWSNLDKGNLHVPRLDLEHLKVRKATHDFIHQYKGDLSFTQAESKNILKGYKYTLDEKGFFVGVENRESTLESEKIKFQLTVGLITGNYQSTIEWLTNKEIIDTEISALLFNFQPGLLKINSILEDSKENKIVLEIDTRKMIEDLLSPLLDGLYKIRMAEEKNAKELIQSLKNKVNENYQKGLEQELILSGLKK